MKVLLLNDFGALQGGAEAQLTALRRLLRARGHDVQLFTSTASYANLPLQSDHICKGSTTWSRAATQVVNLSAVRALRQVLHAFKPDVVHARVIFWQLSPLILPLLRHVPSIFNPADYKPACPTAKKVLPSGAACTQRRGVACLREGCCPLPPQWALEMLQHRLWLRNRDFVDCVVAQSEGSKRQLESLGIAVDEVIHNGVVERAPRPPLSEAPLIAFAGRLSPEKGIRTLMEAFRRVLHRVPEARLLVAGEGRERKAIEKRVVQWRLAGQVELTGHLEKPELEARLDHAWVQVVPSIWHEPFPNVAAEAMMRGTAVVASRMGGLPEIVESGTTGILVPARDPAALAEALTGLLEDRAQTERMGRAGRERAIDYFGMERSTGRFERLYERLMG